jgi:hypothetical protein
MLTPAGPNPSPPFLRSWVRKMSPEKAVQVLEDQKILDAAVDKEIEYLKLKEKEITNE